MRNIATSSSFGRYLGVQVSPNRLKKSDYLDLVQKTKDKISGWQAKLLNMAGRSTLIKSVLNSYPLYAMQTSLLPSSILDDLTKLSKKFLWNKVDRSRFIPRTKWSTVTQPMAGGGLGIRNLRIWNLAFMAKLGWKILTQPTKLWVQILQARYLSRSNFLDCFPHSNDSPLWYGRIFLKVCLS